VFSFTLDFNGTYSFVLTALHFSFLSVFTTENTNIDAPGGIRKCNPNKRLAADLRFRPLGYWDRQDSITVPSVGSEPLYEPLYQLIYPSPHNGRWFIY
jgi:hypothetical protein